MQRYVQLGLFLSILTFAPVVLADNAAMSEAQARFNEGLEYADGAKYEEARLKFLQAFAVLKAPAVLFNLASAEQKTGHEVEAVEHYRAFLKSSATDTRITDAMRDKARQNIADLLKKVAQVEIEAPDGAKIAVDGKPLEEAPREPVAVAAGKHTVEAAWSGRVKSVRVEAKVGQIVKAAIAADGGATEPPAVAATEERSAAGWAVPIGLGALGLAGLVTGGILASASQSSKDDAEALRQPGVCASPTPACAEYDDKRASAESQATGAYVGYVAGGVLVAASIATFVLWPKSSQTRPAEGVRVMPSIGVHGAGASLRVAF